MEQPQYDVDDDTTFHPGNFPHSVSSISVGSFNSQGHQIVSNSLNTGHTNQLSGDATPPSTPSYRSGNNNSNDNINNAMNAPSFGRGRTISGSSSGSIPNGVMLYQQQQQQQRPTTTSARPSSPSHTRTLQMQPSGIQQAYNHTQRPASPSNLSTGPPTPVNAQTPTAQTNNRKSLKQQQHRNSTSSNQQPKLSEQQQQQQQQNGVGNNVSNGDNRNSRQSSILKPKQPYIFKVALVGAEKVGKSSIVRQLSEGKFSQNYNPTITMDIVTKSIYIIDDTVDMTASDNNKSNTTTNNNNSNVNQQTDDKNDDIKDGGDDDEKDSKNNNNNNNNNPCTNDGKNNNNHNTIMNKNTSNDDNNIDNDGHTRTKIHLQLWDSSGRPNMKNVLPSILRDTMACLLVYDVTQRDTFDVIKDEYLSLIKRSKPDVLTLLIANKVDLLDGYGDNGNTNQNDQNKNNLKGGEQNNNINNQTTIRDPVVNTNDTIPSSQLGDIVIKTPSQDPTDDLDQLDNDAENLKNKADNESNNIIDGENLKQPDDNADTTQDNNPTNIQSIPEHDVIAAASNTLPSLNQFHIDTSNIVQYEEAQAFARDKSLPFIQISAKDGNNIKLLFTQLASVLPMLLIDDNEDDNDLYDDDGMTNDQIDTALTNDAVTGDTSCLNDTYCNIM